MTERSGTKKQVATPCKVEVSDGSNMSDPKASSQLGKDRLLRSRKSSESELELFFNSNEDGSVSPNITLLTELLRREGALNDGNRLCRVSGTYLTEKLVVAVIKINWFSEAEIHKWICSCFSKRILSGESFSRHINQIVGKYDKAAGASVVEKQKYLERAGRTLYVVPADLEVEKPRFSKQKIVGKKSEYRNATSKRIKSEQAKVGSEGRESLVCVKKFNVDGKSNVRNLSSPALIMKVDPEVSSNCLKNDDIQSGPTPYLTRGDKELGVTSVPTTYSNPGSVLHAHGEPSKLDNPSRVVDSISRTLSTNGQTKIEKIAQDLPIPSSSVEVTRKNAPAKKKLKVCDGVMASAKAKVNPVLEINRLTGLDILNSMPSVIITPKFKETPNSGDNLAKGLPMVRSTPDVVVTPKVKGGPVSSNKPATRVGATSSTGVMSGTPEVLDRLGKYGISIRVITEDRRKSSCGVVSSTLMESDKVSSSLKWLQGSEICTRTWENQNAQSDVVSNLSRVTESGSTMISGSKKTSAHELQGVSWGNRSDGNTNSVTVSQTKCRDSEKHSVISDLKNKIKTGKSQIDGDREKVEKVTRNTTTRKSSEKGKKNSPLSRPMKGKTVSITVCRKVVKHTIKIQQNDQGSTKEVAESVEEDNIVGGHEKFVDNGSDTYMSTCNDNLQSVLQDVVCFAKNEIPVRDEGDVSLQTAAQDELCFDSSDALDSIVDLKLPSHEKSHIDSQGETCLQDIESITCTLQKKCDIEDSESNEFKNVVKPQDLDFEVSEANVEASECDPCLAYSKRSMFDGIFAKMRNSTQGDAPQGEAKNKENCASDIILSEEAEGNEFHARNVVIPIAPSNAGKLHMNNCVVSDGNTSVLDNIGSCGSNSFHMTTRSNTCVTSCKEQEPENDSDITFQTNGNKILCPKNDNLVPQCSVKDVPGLTDSVVLFKDKSLRDEEVIVNQNQSCEHIPSNASVTSDIGIVVQKSVEDSVMDTVFCKDSPSEDIVPLPGKTTNSEIDSKSFEEHIDIAVDEMIKDEGSRNNTDTISEASVSENVHDPAVEKSLEGFGRMVMEEGSVIDTNNVKEDFVEDDSRVAKELNASLVDEAEDTNSNNKEVRCRPKITDDDVTPEEVWEELEVVVHDKGNVKETSGSTKGILEDQKINGDGPKGELAPVCLAALCEGFVNDDSGEICENQKAIGVSPKADIASKTCEDFVDESQKDKDETSEDFTVDVSGAEEAPANEGVVGEESPKNKEGEVAEDQKILGDPSKAKETLEDHEKLVAKETLRDIRSKDTTEDLKTLGDPSKAKEMLEDHEKLVAKETLRDIRSKNNTEDQKTKGNSPEACEGSKELVGHGFLKDVNGMEVPKDQKMVRYDLDGGHQDMDGKEIPKNSKLFGGIPLGEAPECCRKVSDEFQKEKEGIEVHGGHKTVGGILGAEKVEVYEKVEGNGSGCYENVGEVSEDQKPVRGCSRVEGHEEIIDEIGKIDGNDIRAELPEINQANPAGSKVSKTGPRNLEAQVSLVNPSTCAVIEATGEETGTSRVEIICPETVVSPEVPLGNRKPLKAPVANIEEPKEGEPPDTPGVSPKRTEVKEVEPSCDTGDVSEVLMESPKKDEMPESFFNHHEVSELSKAHPDTTEEVGGLQINPKDQNLMSVPAISAQPEMVKIPDVRSSCLELLKVYDDDHNLIEENPSLGNGHESLFVGLEGTKPAGESGSLKNQRSSNSSMVLRTVDSDPVNSEVVKMGEAVDGLEGVVTGTCLEEEEASGTPGSPEEMKIGVYSSNVEETSVRVPFDNSEEGKANNHVGTLKVGKPTVHHSIPEEMKTKTNVNCGATKGSICLGSPEETRTSSHSGSLDKTKAGSHLGKPVEGELGTNPPETEASSLSEEVIVSAHPDTPEELEASGHPDISEEIKVRTRPDIQEVKIHAYPKEIKSSAHTANTKEMKSQSSPAHSEKGDVDQACHSPREAVDTRNYLDNVQAASKACSSPPQMKERSSDIQSQSASTGHLLTLETVEPVKYEPIGVPKACLSSEMIKSLEDKPVIEGTKPHLGVEVMEEYYSSNVEHRKMCSIALEKLKNPKVRKDSRVPKPHLGTLEATEGPHGVHSLEAPKTDTHTTVAVKPPKGRSTRITHRTCLSATGITKVPSDSAQAAHKTDLLTQGPVKLPKGKRMRSYKAHLSTAKTRKGLNELLTSAASKAQHSTAELGKPLGGRKSRGAPKARFCTPKTKDVLYDKISQGAPRAHLSTLEAMERVSDSPGASVIKSTLVTSEIGESYKDEPTLATPMIRLNNPEGKEFPSDSTILGTSENHITSETVQSVSEDICSPAELMEIDPTELMEIDSPAELMEIDPPSVPAPKLHLSTAETVKTLEGEAAVVTPEIHVKVTKAVKPPEGKPVLAAPLSRHSSSEVLQEKVTLEALKGVTELTAAKNYFSTPEAVKPLQNEPSEDVKIQKAPKARTDLPGMFETLGDSAQATKQDKSSPTEAALKTNSSSPEVIEMPDSLPPIVIPEVYCYIPEAVEAADGMPFQTAPKAPRSTQDSEKLAKPSPLLGTSIAHPNEVIEAPNGSQTWVAPKDHINTFNMYEAIQMPTSSTQVTLKARICTAEETDVLCNAKTMVASEVHLSNIEKVLGNSEIEVSSNSPVSDLCSSNGNDASCVSSQAGKEYLAHNMNPEEEDLDSEICSVKKPKDVQAQGSLTLCEDMGNNKLLELSKECTGFQAWGQGSLEVEKGMNVSGMEQDSEPSGSRQDWESVQREDREYLDLGDEKECVGSRNSGEKSSLDNSRASVPKGVCDDNDQFRNLGVPVPVREDNSFGCSSEIKSQKLKEDSNSEELKKGCKSQKWKKDCNSAELKKDFGSSEPEKDYVVQTKKSNTSSEPAEDGKVPSSKMEYVASEMGNDLKSAGSKWDDKICETKNYFENSGSLQDSNSSGHGRGNRSSRPKESELSKPKKDSSSSEVTKECKSSVLKKDCNPLKTSKNYESSGGQDGASLGWKESDFSKAAKDHDDLGPRKGCDPSRTKISSRSRKDTGTSGPKRDHKHSESRKECDYHKSRKDKDLSRPKKVIECSEDGGHLNDSHKSKRRDRFEYKSSGKSYEREMRKSCKRSLEQNCPEESRYHPEGSSKPEHCDKRSEACVVSASTHHKGSACNAQMYETGLRSKEDGNGRSEKARGSKRERSRGRDGEEMNIHAKKPYEDIVKKLKITEDELQQWKVKCKEQSLSAEWKREIEKLRLVNKDLQKAKSMLSDQVISMKEKIGVQKVQIQTLSEQLEGFVSSAKVEEMKMKDENPTSPKNNHTKVKSEPKSPDVSEAFHGWHEDQIKSNRAFVKSTGFALKSAIASLQKRHNVSRSMKGTMTETNADCEEDMVTCDASGELTHVEAEQRKTPGQRCKEEHAEEVISCSSSEVIKGGNFEENGLRDSDQYPLDVKQVQDKNSYPCRIPEVIKNIEKMSCQKADQGDEAQSNNVLCKVVKVEPEQEFKLYSDSWTEPETIVCVDSWTQSNPVMEKTYEPGKIEELENKIKEAQSDNAKLVHKLQEQEDELADKEIEWLKVLWDKEVQIKKNKNSKPENSDVKEKGNMDLSGNHESTPEASLSGEIKYQDSRIFKGSCKFGGEVDETPCEKFKVCGKDEAERKRKAEYSSHPIKNPQGEKKVRMNEGAGSAFSSDDGHKYDKSGDASYKEPRVWGSTQPYHDISEDKSKGLKGKRCSPEGHDLPPEDEKRVKVLRMEVQELKEQLERQKCEFETARRQIQILEKQLEVRSNDRNEIKHMMKLKEQHTIKVLNQYELSLKGKSNQIEDLQATVNKMKEQLEVMAKMQKDFTTREKGYKDIQAQLEKKLSEINGSLCKKQEQVVLLQTQVAFLRKQVEEKTKLLKEKDVQADISEVLNKDLQKQMHNENKSLSETIEKMETQMSKLREEVKDLSHKASKEETEALSAKREKEGMSKVLATKEKELAKFVRDRQREQEVVTRKEEELRNCALKMEELKKSLSSLEEKECVLKDQLQRMDDKLNKQIQEKNSLQEQLKGKEEEHKTATSSFEKMMEDFESSQRNCVSYQEEINTLKKKLEEHTQAFDSTIAAERERMYQLKEKHAMEMKAKKKLQNELYKWKHRKSRNVQATKQLQEEMNHLKENALHHQARYEAEKDVVAQLSELLKEESEKVSQLKNQLISMDKVAEELRRLLKAEQDECIDQIQGQLEIFCATTDRYRCQKDRIDRILNNPFLQVRIDDFQENETS